MKKIGKKIICIGISVGLMVSLAGISAFADDNSRYIVKYDDSKWAAAAEATGDAVAIDGTNIISGLSKARIYFDVTNETQDAPEGDSYLKLTAKDEYSSVTGDGSNYLAVKSGGKSLCATSGVYNYSMMFKVGKRTDDISNKLLMSARMTNDVTWNYALKVVGLSNSQRENSLCIGLGGVDFDNSNMQKGYNTWTTADAWYKYYININYYTNKVTVGITNMETGEELFSPYTAVFDPAANSNKLSKLDTTVSTSVRRYGADYAIDDITENRDIFLCKDITVDESTDTITASAKFANDVLANAYNPPYNGKGHEPVLIISSYANNGRQLKINSVQPEIERTKGVSDAVTWIDASVSVDKTGEYDHAKAYIWRSVDDMLPLCKATEEDAQYSTDENGVLSFNGSIENFDKVHMIINGAKVFDDVHFDNTVKYAAVYPGNYDTAADAFKNALYVGETEYSKEDGSYLADFKIKAASGKYKLIVYTSADGYKAYDFSHVSHYFTECNDDIKNNASLSAEEKRSEMLKFIDTYKAAFGIDTEAYTRLPDSVKAEIADAVIAHEDFAGNDELNEFMQTYDMVSLLFINAADVNVLAEYLKAAADFENGRFNTTAVKRLNEMTDESRAAVLTGFMGKPLTENFNGDLIYSIYTLKHKDVTYYEQLSEFINDKDNLFGFDAEAIAQYNNSSNKSGILKTFNAKLKGTINSMEDVYSALNYAIANPEKQSYGGGGGGGSTNSSSSGHSTGATGGIISTPTVVPEIKDEKKFDDLPNGHWAYEAVMSLRKEGIINGISENVFDPDSNVTREQFVKMLTAGLRMTGVEADVKFSDVNENDWFYNAVGAAVRAGIVNGVNENSFGVGMFITREQAAVMVKRAADRRSLSIKKTEETEFSDADRVSDYARNAVKELASSGIINGDSGKFNPQNSLTRAEAATILYRFFVSAEIVK
ncbi:MAG: S-layer homology domain-containing protein [Clostridia bacterium]|nr:S-layer homology domain-containing protein [Clostridia bacterium]